MTTIFRCFLKKKDSIIKLLENKPAGYSHPFKGMLLTHTGDGNITETPINTDANFYINTASSDDITGQVEKSFSEFPTLVGNYSGYTRQTVKIGQSGEFTTRNGEVLLASGAKCKPTFFDLGVYTTGATRADELVTCYSSKDTIKGLRHSGDHRAGELFLHTITVTDINDCVDRILVVSSCGYNRNPLHSFAPSNPHILMIDEENKIVYTIPFTLERAAIGNSLLIAPLIIKQSSDGKIRWYVPDTPLQYLEINTGEYPQALRDMVKKVSDTFDTDFQALQDRANARNAQIIATTEPNTGELESLDQSVPEQSPEESKFKETCMTLFVENGVSMPIIDPQSLTRKQIVLCHIGNTLRPLLLEKQPDKQPASNVNLPILSGEAAGHRTLALGVQSCVNDITQEAWLQHIIRNPSLVYASPQWIESLMDSKVHSINGVLVVSCNLPSSACNSKEQLEDTLNNLCIPCTRLMGSCAVILIFDENSKKHFYYRGPHALWSGLFPENLCFADEVDFSVKQFELFAMELQSTATSTLFNFAVPAEDKRIIWQGEVFESAGPIVDLLKAVSSVEALCALRPHIQSAFAQISVGYSTTEVRDLQLQIREIVNKQIQLLLAPVRQRREEIKRLLTPETLEELSKELKTLRGTERAMTREVKFILNDLELLSSCQLTSTRNVSLQSSVRKAAIQKNVEDASSMTPAEFGDMLEKVCDWLIVAQAHEKEMLELLHATSEKNLEPLFLKMGENLIARSLEKDAWPEDLQSALVNFRNSEYDKIKGPVCLCPNCTMFDPSTMACLLEGTGAGEADNHLLATKGTPIAFRMQGQISNLVVPCLNDTREWNGEFIDFINRTNEPSIAKYRILFRAHLSNLRLRDCPIDVRSKELSLASVFMMLSIMESIRSRLSCVPTQADRDTTTCEMMRGLMDLALTFAAAGTTPASFVFQLTQPHANIKLPSTPGEWTLYALVSDLFGWTGMKQVTKTAQTRMLVVRALRKALVDPVAEPLRAGVAVAKKVDSNNSQKERNIALQWYQALCKLFYYYDPKKGSISSEIAMAIAQRLLDNVPKAGKHKTTLRKSIRSLNMVKAGQVLTKEDWEYIREYVAQIYIKYSGCFKKSKEDAIAKAQSYQDPKSIIDKTVKSVAKELQIDPKKVTVKNRNLFVLPEDVATLKEAVGKMKGCADNTLPKWNCRCEHNPDRATDAVRKTDKTPDKTRKKSLDEQVKDWANLQCPEDLTCEALLGGLLDDLLDKKAVPQESDVKILDKEQMQLTSVPVEPDAFDELKKLDPSKSREALELADQIGTMTVIDVLKKSKLPIGPLISLLLSAGCSPSNMRDIIAAVLRELLLGWQDVVASEQKAVKVFEDML